MHVVVIHKLYIYAKLSHYYIICKFLCVLPARILIERERETHRERERHRERQRERERGEGGSRSLSSLVLSK